MVSDLVTGCNDLELFVTACLVIVLCSDRRCDCLVIVLWLSCLVLSCPLLSCCLMLYRICSCDFLVTRQPWTKSAFSCVLSFHRGSSFDDGVRESQDNHKARHDTTRHDTTRQDTARQDTTRHDTTPHDTTPQDKTRQDKTRQDKTRQDKTRQDKTRQDKTRQDETRLN